MEQDLHIKLLSFDYFITILICKFYKASRADNCVQIVKDTLPTNKLSKLKLMKLLYFACAIKVNKGWYLLDKVFDNFYALPYGPVESTLYDHLTEIPNYIIGSSDVKLKSEKEINFEYELDDEIKRNINDALDALSTASPTIFSLSAFELVELSHKCDSWKIAISEANAFGSLSKKMSNESIKRSKLCFA